MKQVAVIGGGTMGNGIAQVLASSGFQVNLVDASPEALVSARLSIQRSLRKLVEKGKLPLGMPDEIVQRIQGFSDLEAAVKNCQLVIEAIPEKKVAKQELFRKLDRYCSPETLLATNTSSISITALASATNRPHLVIGMHFMNPVPLMPLVEVIPGLLTAKETVSIILNLAIQLGKTPHVAADYPGFISNRILLPMLNESIICLQEKVGGVHEIDQIMKLGMGHPIGPLQLADFIGLDVCLAILNVLHEGMGDAKYAPAWLLKQMVEAGRLGVKTREGFYSYDHAGKLISISPPFQNL